MASSSRAPKRSRPSTPTTFPPISRTLSPLFSDRKIIFESDVHVFYHDEYATAIAYLERSGLQALYIPARTAYPRLVRLFYQNLRAEGSLDDLPSFRLTTHILGVELSYTIAEISDILELRTEPPAGMVEMPFCIPPVHIVHALSCGVSDKGHCHRRSHMIPDMWFVDYVLHANLFQSGHQQERRGRFQQALYAAFTGRWFPAGREIAIGMWQATSRIYSSSRHRDTQILPYPRIITSLIAARAPTLLDRIPESGRVTVFPELDTPRARAKYVQGLSRHREFEAKHGAGRITPEQALTIEATVPLMDASIDLDDEEDAAASRRPEPVPPQGPHAFAVPSPAAPGAGERPRPPPQASPELHTLMQQVLYQQFVCQGLQVDQLNLHEAGYGDARYAYHTTRARAVYPTAYPDQAAHESSQHSVPSYHPAPPEPRPASPSVSSRFAAPVQRDFSIAGPSIA